MKLVEDSEVILGNSSNSNKFKIAASAKAFKILSSGLYKNKPRAIIRELSCNAVDAHILNGNTEPFLIKAPTQLDPRFVIRDYGPGLNDEDVRNLYSTYFASTKNNSNDFIGALGLGSKSPFSYTDTFTVVSYNGGIARGYTAMLDGGEPVLRPIFEEKMKEDEKTGIEITVPVKLNDIMRWHEEIRYVLRPFNPSEFRLVGCSQPECFPPREGKNKEWFSLNQYVAGLYAVYGKIVYPLDGVPGLTKSWMQINNRSVYIHFDLGELDIAASREELSLDEQTVENIINRVNSLSKIDMKDTVDKLEAITNERELLRTIDSMSQEAVKAISAVSNVANIFMLRNKFAPKDSWAEVGCVYDISIETKMKRIKSTNRYYGSTQGYNLNELYGYKNETINIMIDDKPSKRVKVIRGLAYQGKLKGKIVVFSEDNPEHMKVMNEVIEIFKGDKVNIIRSSENEDLIKLIPVNMSDSSEKRPASNNVHTYTLNKEGTYDIEHSRMVSEELKELEGFVILRKRDDFFEFPSQKEIINLNEIQFNSIVKSLKIQKFHVIRSTVVDRLIKYGNCDSLFDEITNTLLDISRNVTVDQYIGSPSSQGSRIIGVASRDSKKSFILNHLSKSKGTPESELLNSIAGIINFYPKDYKDHDIHEVISTIKANREIANKNIDQSLKEFQKKNPLVYYVLNNCYSINDDIIEDIKYLLNRGTASAVPTTTV